MRDLVEEAWSRAVPLSVAREYGRSRGYSTMEGERRDSNPHFPTVKVRPPRPLVPASLPKTPKKKP